MTAINEGTDLTLTEGIGVITLDFPPVNAMSPALMDGLYDAVMAALDDDRVKAILLICAGRTFIAGADLKSLGKSEPKVDFFGLQSRIEGASKPTIAAIHGTALGGGMETALTFHYRIAVPSARMGLPEVTLGLLPGGGGTQRLPRIVGAEAALDMLVSGRQVAAPEALRLGLIDRLAREGELRADALAYALELAAAGGAPKRVRDLDDKIAVDRADPGLIERFQASHAKSLRGLDAPQAVVRCVAAAIALPFEDGLAVERAEFQKVMHGPQSAALRHVFMAERAAQKIPGLAADLALAPIRKIGVVGAGTMGGGIAMAFLGAGFPVTLIEAKAEALDRGMAAIIKTYGSRVARGKMRQDEADALLARITPSLALSDLADADLVVEAVFEDMALKKAVFTALDAIVRPDAILASNTSFLNIDEIARATGRPERVLGLHFFSPANVMRLLEVVRGAKTSDGVLAAAMQLARKLGKAAVVSKVCHGFIANRMLSARQVQADGLVLDGVAPWDIDRVVSDFGFPMGPFAMLDMAGLDIGWTRERSTGSTVRERLCEAGRLGQKTKAGYYDYDDARRATPSPVTLDLIAKLATTAPGASRLDDRQILNRLLFPVINEGARILEEGVALRASDIDLAWVTGYGWPAHLGGPMFYADRLGLKAVLDGLGETPEVTPSPLLVKLAAQGAGFASL